MVLRIVATMWWVGVAGVGIHMMCDPSFYEQWASLYESDGSIEGAVFAFLGEMLLSLGGIDAGRVLTILGSCMIAGTWIPSAHRKRRAELTAPNTYKRDDERILLGDVGEEPKYDIRI